MAGRAVLTTAVVLLAAATAQADTLRGRVVDPDGRPVAGAQVSVSGATAAPLTTAADASGVFVIAGLPEGATVEVIAWAPGFVSSPARMVVSDTELELRLAVSAVRETLTVTASQVDTPLSLLGDSVTVLSREELDARQITTLGDALRLVPGFAVARNGGPGTVTSVFPRGGESDYTLVLVDGVRMNSFGGGLDFSQVPIDAAERVEIVRGPQSALYGSDAIGGVVQVVTGRGGPAVLDALVEGGGRAARRAAVSARGSLGNWQGAAAGQYMRDDGFTGVAPADGSTVSNDDSRLSDASLGLGWRGDGGTDLFGTLRYVDSDRGSPGPYGSDPAGNFGGVDRTSRSLTQQLSGAARLVQPLGSPSSRVRLRAEADVADFDLEYRSEFGSEGETTRGHGRLQADAALAAGLSASVGGEWVGESGRSTYIVAGAEEVPVDRDVWAGFAEVRWQPAARLSFTGGARASRITRQALAGNPATFSPRPPFDDDTVVAVNPKVTAAWTVVDGGGLGTSTRLHAAAGTGIRPPDAFEIAFTDNAGLKPERSNSVEAGVTQTFAHGAVHADATWFHNRYDDLIVTVGRFNSSSRYTTDNIANARARGAELALTLRPASRLTARATYTFLDSEVLAVDGTEGQAPSPFVVGDPLLRRPRHQGSVDVAWGTSRAQAFATVAMRGDTLDVEPNFGTFGGLYENEGYAVVTLGGSWTIVPQLTAFARVANLFDAQYEDTLGYPALGRTAYVGLRVAAGR
jgi:outer membrane cobalamin receptor